MIETETESKPIKRSQTKLLVAAFLAGFLLVELGIGLDFYFREANHNNDGLDVLLGSFAFALMFAVPAGLVLSLLAWGIRTWQLKDALKP